MGSQKRSGVGEAPVRGALDAVGVGYSCFDFLGTHRGLPRKNSKSELSSVFLQGGGPTATALVTLARLGARAALIARMGDDLLGRAAKQELLREGVDVTGLTLEPGATSQCAFIIVDEETAERTVLWTRGTVSPLRPEELHRGLILSARCLLIDDLEIEAQAAAAAIAKEAGIPVVLDAGTARAGVEKLVSLADHVVASEEFAPAYTGEKDPGRAAQALLREGARVAVVTLGERGCLARDEEGRRYEQDAFKVKAVDTTGAGDVFHGAYAKALLEGWDTRKALEFASAAAALKCTKPGGRSGIPTMGQVAAFLGW